MNDGIYNYDDFANLERAMQINLNIWMKKSRNLRPI